MPDHKTIPALRPGPTYAVTDTISATQFDANWQTPTSNEDKPLRAKILFKVSSKVRWERYSDHLSQQNLNPWFYDITLVNPPDGVSRYLRVQAHALEKSAIEVEI